MPLEGLLSSRMGDGIVPSSLWSLPLFLGQEVVSTRYYLFSVPGPVKRNLDGDGHTGSVNHPAHIGVSGDTFSEWVWSPGDTPRDGEALPGRDGWTGS